MSKVRRYTPALSSNTPLVPQPVVAGKTLDGLLRTSMDLEMDLQVSRTRQARLDQELLVLRELKEQMEKARQEAALCTTNRRLDSCLTGAPLLSGAHCTNLQYSRRHRDTSIDVKVYYGRQGSAITPQKGDHTQ